MKLYQLRLAGVVFRYLTPYIFAQQTEQPTWQFAPSLLFVDYFHSGTLQSDPGRTYDFNGEGLTLQVRSFNKHLDPLSLTLSAGVIWYKNTGSIAYNAIARPEERAANAVLGIGSLLRYNDFTDFPVAVGLDMVFPKSQNHEFMVFFGGSMITNFIDGQIDPNQQIKVGYKVGGGLTVMMFEFSVHYYSFSDISNIGTSIGLRLNSFAPR